jgi:hypothetical protein
VADGGAGGLDYVHAIFVAFVRKKRFLEKNPMSPTKVFILFTVFIMPLIFVL